VIETRSFHYQGQVYQLQAEVVSCGQDLCILVSGGDRPHIGAAALGAWTDRAFNSEKKTATASVISVPGHKEAQLALEAAEKLSKTLQRTVLVTAGIHIDDIDSELIDRVVVEFQTMIADLSEILGA
jgi:succinyl-CoA synthetase alpha subunit